MTFTQDRILPASFRDPNGFVFREGDHLYRQVNHPYAPHYDLLMSSGLYQYLVEKKLLVAHQEVNITPPLPELAYRVLEPEPIPFISYPYEWCYNQLKEAALLTLALQKRALSYGMSLKDASAYNIQFLRSRPVLIDTLSFEQYQEGRPWVAYRQFCQHFLAPLALMAYRDVRLSQMLRNYIDGIPLDLASRLLPWWTRLNFGLLSHLHLHAGAQKRYADQNPQQPQRETKVSKTSLIALVENLQRTVRKLTWKPGGTEWAEYYKATNYSQIASDAKASLVREYLEKIEPKSVLDLGANTGLYSRLASEKGIPTLACDIDPSAVEFNYRQVREQKEQNILPLVIDLTNPSPALGWENRERETFFTRQKADTVLALALIHHLAIANNVPLPHLAHFFSRLGHWLIIEFVPKEDSQVQRLLASRLDIFPNYTVAGFEVAFCEAFQIKEKRPIPESTRILYLLENLTTGHPI